MSKSIRFGLLSVLIAVALVAAGQGLWSLESSDVRMVVAMIALILAAILMVIVVVKAGWRSSERRAT